MTMLQQTNRFVVLVVVVVVGLALVVVLVVVLGLEVVRHRTFNAFKKFETAKN